MNCPCGSGKVFDRCCGALLSYQLVAENAEQLMRSRYTAYVENDAEYILKTWHPDHRPDDLQMDEKVNWINLRIIDFSSSGNKAIVEFEALLQFDGRIDALHEKSQFVFEKGGWLYTTGKMMDPTNKPWKPGRNSACFCGSGKKYKKCCANKE